MNSLELNTLSLTELNGVEMKEKQGGAGILRACLNFIQQ